MTNDDFKTIFKEHYWDIRKQSEIRNKVINGRYNPKIDNSMGEHMMKVAQIAKFLEPLKEERELISLIAGHFPSEIRSAIIVARLDNLKETMRLLKDLQGYGESNCNTETDMNQEGNSRGQMYQGRNDRANNHNRFQYGPQFAINNQNNNNNNQNYRNRNGNNGYPRNNGNNQNRNNNYRRNETINHIQIDNRRRNQEVNQRNSRVNSREQLTLRGNTRGRRGGMMRLGQRARYSNQEGNDDRSDRSPSPNEMSSRIEVIRDERLSDTHDMDRDNDRRRVRETTQHLN